MSNTKPNNNFHPISFTFSLKLIFNEHYRSINYHLDLLWIVYLLTGWFLYLTNGQRHITGKYVARKQHFFQIMLFVRNIFIIFAV